MKKTNAQCIWFEGCKKRDIYARLLCRDHYFKLAHKIAKGQKSWDQFELGGYCGPSRTRKKT